MWRTRPPTPLDLLKFWVGAVSNRTHENGELTIGFTKDA